VAGPPPPPTGGADSNSHCHCRARLLALEIERCAGATNTPTNDCYATGEPGCMYGGEQAGEGGGPDGEKVDHRCPAKSIVEVIRDGRNALNPRGPSTKASLRKNFQPGKNAAFIMPARVLTPSCRISRPHRGIRVLQTPRTACRSPCHPQPLLLPRSSRRCSSSSNPCNNRLNSSHSSLKA
jgi:hypothetical protein